MQDSLFDASTSLKSLKSVDRRRGSTEGNAAEGGDDGDTIMGDDSDSGTTITNKKQVYSSKRNKNKD
jgi:hypothetical protein